MLTRIKSGRFWAYRRQSETDPLPTVELFLRNSSMLQSPEQMAQTPEAPANGSAHCPDVYCPRSAREVDDPRTCGD